MGGSSGSSQNRTNIKKIIDLYVVLICSSGIRELVSGSNLEVRTCQRLNDINHMIIIFVVLNFFEFLADLITASKISLKGGRILAHHAMAAIAQLEDGQARSDILGR